MNKVVSSIHLSPGRSFQSSTSSIYEFVRYLKEDSNRHDFTHAVHKFSFSTDESDVRKKRLSSEMKERMDIVNWTGTLARCVRVSFSLRACRTIAAMCCSRY